jgi:hypothetical protein
VELGRAAGVALPTLTGLVDLSRILLRGEPWQRARTLEALGLAGLGPDGIRDVVEGGVSQEYPASEVRNPKRIQRSDGEGSWMPRFGFRNSDFGLVMLGV